KAWSDMRAQSARRRRPFNPDALDISDVAGWRKDLPQEIKDVLNAPVRLTLEQSSEGLTVKSAEHTDEYTAGEKSVVSYGSDVSDRIAGWSGRTFVVSLHAVEGDRLEERYSLDKSGRLVLFRQSSGGELPGLRFKCVYDRATASDASVSADPQGLKSP